MSEVLADLESNNPLVAEETKQKIQEQFALVQDAWLVSGIYDYYAASHSIRAIEILVNVREPHHNHLFQKLSEVLKNPKNEARVQALTLLGHVLRKEPPWLYKITEHQLLRDLLKILKTEADILLLLSALLALVVLLPIVPSRMGPFLPEVFEIFSRLAAWNSSNPEKLEQMVHLQVALYALFQRLYGMYPCNFLAYLRNRYRNREQMPIFMHTIWPMLDTVKMHPSLVTASKDKETTTERWIKMGTYDVVVECERLLLDVGDRCQHEPCYLTSSFRSRSGTTNSSSFEASYQLKPIKSTSVASLAVDAKDFFCAGRKILTDEATNASPPDTTAPTPIPHSQLYGMGQGLVASIGLSSQEGTSPPEAAIEATPETTPIKDIRLSSRNQLPSSASAVRTLSTLTSRNWSIGSSSSTPSHSQPSSPMRKESSPFNFPADSRTSAFGLPRREPYAAQKLQRMMQDRTQAMEGESSEVVVRAKTPILHPTSPLRVIPNEAGFLHSLVQRIESPVSQEDKEVVEIVEQGELEVRSSLRQCDSVLQENEGGRGTEEDLDECVQEHGSPCAAGGLHMPNSKSMNDFAKRVRRLRYHSQCATEPELREASTGSSPGNYVPFPSNTVRRANSCPEMKKSLVPPKDNRNKTLVETDEETNKDNSQGDCKLTQKSLTTTETQTENCWAMPYEHLFLGIFPSLETGDVKPSPAPSPAPLNVQQDKFPTGSPYEILDKYIDIAVHGIDKDASRCQKEHLDLLHQHLLFERSRREIHALKNRRLLAEAKNTKALEEHNSALRDQIQLQQKDIDSLKDQLKILKLEQLSRSKQIYESVQHWENKYISLQLEYKLLKQHAENVQGELDSLKLRSVDLDNKWQKLEAALLDAKAEVKIAREQAWAGEKGKAELERANKELLLSGEMQLRYQEKLAQIPLLKRSDQELARLSEIYQQELKGMNQQLESKATVIEGHKLRLAELEHLINQYDERAAMQRRILNQVKDEYNEKLKAVESKYQTQQTISRCFQQKLVELWHKANMKDNPTLPSPDTSSCHEVQATLTDRSSAAASPPSASLASSEGTTAGSHFDGRETKNFQHELVSSSTRGTATEEEPGNELGAVGFSQPSSSFSSFKQN